MAKPKVMKPERKLDVQQDFYEVMPHAPAMSFRDDTYNDYSDDSDMGTPAGKTTAIITLVTLAIVVAALGFMVVRGIDAISARPIITAPSSL
jgi:hypothetical protein